MVRFFTDLKFTICVRILEELLMEPSLNLCCQAGCAILTPW